MKNFIKNLSDSLVLKILIEIVSFTFICSLAFILNKTIELFGILLSYTLTINLYPYHYHCKTFSSNIALIFGAIAVALFICLEKRITIVSSALFGGLISFSLYFINIYYNLSKMFTIDANLRLRLKMLNVRDIDMAVDILSSDLSDKQLADKYFVLETTIRQQRWRLKNKLK